MKHWLFGQISNKVGIKSSCHSICIDRSGSSRIKIVLLFLFKKAKTIKTIKFFSPFEHWYQLTVFSPSFKNINPSSEIWALFPNYRDNIQFFNMNKIKKDVAVNGW